MALPTQAATEPLIENLVRRIRERRLESPAVALLELARPFSFLASQGLLLAQPLLGSLLAENRLTGYADLLADRANVDRLMARLEQRDAGGDSAGGEG